MLSTHTRVRCASVFVLYASLALHSQLIPACGVHLDADTKGRLTVNSQLIPACGVHQTALILIATPPNSQLIPACGVHPGSTFCRQLILDSQLIPACGVHLCPYCGTPMVGELSTHTRVRCASWLAEGRQVHRPLSTHTRVRCASAKATKMSCVHGFYMHNFYLIECIRKRFIIAESRTFSISGCRVTPADGANPHDLYWALHIRSDHNSL